MVQSASTPEYMNATSHHSKLRVTVTLSSPLFVAGEEVTGKMEMECRADSGVGVGLIMVELFAIQELNSRDHSATSTFLHSRRLYQGPGIPPSNAVYPHTSPGQDPLPQGHFPARRGVTTFFFQFPLPVSSPSTISFASGLARVRYEVRASVSVAHRGEKRLVTDVADADVVQSQDMDGAVSSHVVVGENGRMYMQGHVVGGRFVSGKRGCVEFHVKNHSAKRTTGLSLSLTRALHLPDATGSRPPLQITDTLISQNYRGAEYTVQPGGEGVATLVFDVPKTARVVKGGLREGSADGSLTAPLFELRCILSIRIGMGVGSKEVLFEMPVQLSHPATLPADLSLSSPEAIPPPKPHFAHPPGAGSDPSSPAYLHSVTSDPQVPPLLASSPSPHAHSPHPGQYPLSTPYYHPATMYPPPNIWSPLHIPYLASRPDPHHQYYFPPPPTVLVPFAHPARPSSAGAQPPTPTDLPGVGIAEPSGLPGVGSVPQTFLSQPPNNTAHKDPKPGSHPEKQASSGVTGAEEGKGARASRIAQHLRAPTRARSASPTAHRFAGSAAVPAEGTQTMHAVPSNSPAALYATTPRNSAVPPILSPRPMRSPRQSISPIVEPGMTARSERVDLLERMVAPQAGEESKSVEEVLQDLERDKTLPSPPVPTGKARAEKLPRARDLFAQRGKVSGKELTVPPQKSVLRPSPIARPLDNGEAAQTHRNVAAASLMPMGSGLDALEKRLIQEVGTRKPDKPERPTILSPSTSAPGEPTSSSPVYSPRTPTRLDALEKRLIQEVGTRKPDKPERPTILSPSTGEPTSSSPVYTPRTPTLPPQSKQRDSEISEIAIPLPSSTERDRHVNLDLDASSSNSPRKETKDSITPRVEADRSRTRTTSAARGKGKDSPRTHETKARQNEALQLRKEAKGRVTSWLDSVTVPSDKENEAKVVGASKNASDDRGDNDSADGVKTPRVNAAPSSLNNLSPQAERHKRSQDLMASKDGKDKTRGNLITSQTPPALSKPSAPSNRPVAMSPPNRAILPKDRAPPIVEEQVLDKIPPRIPKILSSPVAPESKYDFRSARGGKGGITTSVAAIWTSLANESTEVKPGNPMSRPVAAAAPVKRPNFLDVGKSKPTPTSTTKPTAGAEPSGDGAVEQTQQQPNPIKSTFVPAAVNTSVAKAHLSSSASLARPPVDASKGKQPPLSPINEARRRQPPARSEFAFGQARLKDLIKKYQQDAS